MRWPGERLRAPRPTSSCSSPNLASSERASCWVMPLCSTKASISVLVAVEAGAGLVERPDPHARADPARARGQRQPAEQAVDERRLPAAVRADQRDPLAPRQLEVQRAEDEAAAAQLGALEPGGDVAGALAAAEAQLQLPALPRLLDRRRAARAPSRTRAPCPPASPSAPRAARRGSCPGRSPWPSSRPSPTTGAGGCTRSVRRSRWRGVGLVALLGWRAAVARSSR